MVRNDRFGRFNPRATLRPWHVDLGASLDPRGCMRGLSGGDYPLGSPRLLVDFIHCRRSALRHEPRGRCHDSRYGCSLWVRLGRLLG
jgi:hypothetical protein